MEKLSTPEFWQDLLAQLLKWAESDVFIMENLIQIAVGVLILPFSIFAGRWIRKKMQDNIRISIPEQFKIRLIVDELMELIPYLLLSFMLWAAGIILKQLNAGYAVLQIAQTLIIAWVCIRLATAVILDRFWAKTVTLVALSIAILHITGLWGPLVGLLDGIGFTLGDVQLTLLSVFKAALIILIMLRFGFWLSDYFEKKIQSVSSLTPSAHVLVGKTLKIMIISLVVLIGMNSVGLDLSALAVFSGAVGVGVGFGLQKVVANFISGIILLMDKSIKPGDVIEIGEVYGWVSDFKGRYASVVTRDGKEYLIPNEDMITQQVINWSYSSSRIRVKIPVGVSYDADIHNVRELMIQAVDKIDRVLTDPKPACLLKGFGDSSVDLELRFWIKDPQNGMANIRSAVMFKIWDLFKEHDIEIPFPQRDLHLDVESPISVRNLPQSE